MTEQQDLSIALYDSDDARSAALQRKLTAMGHQTVVFTHKDNFLETLEAQGRHQRFDLLLAPLQDDLVKQVLCAGVEEAGMPALLLVERTQWAQMPRRNEDFEGCDAIDFDVSRTTNEELDWRMRALLERYRRAAVQAAQVPGLVWGDYRFLERQRIVMHKGREILLQPRQFDFALELFRNMGRVLTRDWLGSALWRSTSQRDSRVFDVCAANVRKKLALCKENGFVLRAVYKQGYLLSKHTTAHDEASYTASF